MVGKALVNPALTVLLMVLPILVINQFNQASATEQNAPKLRSIGNWSVFVADNPHQCWLATRPAQRVSSYGNNSKKEIFPQSTFLVSLDKTSSDGVEISYSVGSSFDLKNTAWMEITSRKINMVRLNRSLYLKNERRNGAVVSMLAFQGKIEGKMRIVLEKIGAGGKRQRVVDTFNLAGFSEAFLEMERVCGELET